MTRIEALIGFLNEAGRPIGTALVPMDLTITVEGRKVVNLARLNLEAAADGAIHAWSVTSLDYNASYAMVEPLAIAAGSTLRFDPGRLSGWVPDE